jgi:predicted nucleotidyltransferase
VRNEQKKNSDVDIAIEFDESSKKNLLDLVHLEYELRKIFKRKVDLGIFSSINPHILEDVKKQMKIIYEKR